MNGPPNEEAARMVQTPEAAEERSAALSLDDAAEERKRFQELQQRAAAGGYTLSTARTGYVLQRGSHSLHVGDLASIAQAIKARSGKVT